MMDGQRLYEDVAEKAREVLEYITKEKRRAYHRLFMPDGQLSRDAEIVLADLRDVCFARRSTFDIDPRISCVKEGQRRTWLHINGFLELPDDRVGKIIGVDDGLGNE